MDIIRRLLSEGGLSLDRLNNFCRIAEAGGITKAAGSDPGKQSLYSRQIKELEAFFGVKLKVRRGKGMVLTGAGEELARLTRAYLIGLAGFHQTAKGSPKTLSIGSGNSVIEWILMPKMGTLRRALPDVRFECFAARTGTIVSRLLNLTLDVGIVREDAIHRPLRSTPLTTVTYALFVPKKLSPGINATNWRGRISRIPVATSIGGQFREALEAAAIKAKIPLQIVVSCSSFTQAARLISFGEHGAVLPGIARVDFDSSKIQEIPLPLLKAHTRNLCLAWSPRLVEVRPSITRAIDAMNGQSCT